MKLSQLLKVMDKDDDITIYDYNKPTNNEPIFCGNIRKIYKDNPLNKCHIKYLIPCDNRILVEISLDERNGNEISNGMP